MVKVIQCIQQNTLNNFLKNQYLEALDTIFKLEVSFDIKQNNIVCRVVSNCCLVTYHILKDNLQKLEIILLTNRTETFEFNLLSSNPTLKIQMADVQDC